MTFPRHLLTAAGQALYGDRWQSALARDLHIPIRTMQRWAAGVNDPPAGVQIDVLRLLVERAAVIYDLLERVTPR